MRTSYSYLLANLLPTTVVFAILILGRERQLCRLALYSGLTCVPLSLTGLMYGEYWRPTRLGGGDIGVEDMLFTFTAGAAAWLCAVWPYRGTLRVPPHVEASHVVKRILLWGAPSVALLSALWRAGLDPVSATLLAAVPLLTILLVRRRQLWVFALTGLAFFVPVYFAELKLLFAILPDFPLQWSTEGAWTASFLGLPAGEPTWAAAFAILWPVLIASAFEVEFKPTGTTAAASSV